MSCSSLQTARTYLPGLVRTSLNQVALHQLLDLEKEVIGYAARFAAGPLPQVRPTQLHGIEINPYAQELAQIVVWIGFLQWKHHNGFATPRNPVLDPVETIPRMDANVNQDPTFRSLPRRRISSEISPSAE